MSILTEAVSSPSVYSLGAAFYDWLTHHRMQRQVFGEVSKRLPEKGEFLDVCCGPGRLIETLMGDCPGRRMTGLDMAEGALERARRLAPVVHGSATDLPFATGSFDVVLISGALYLIDDRPRVVHEMARVSRGRVGILEASPELGLGAAFSPRRKLGLKARLDYVIWEVAMRATAKFTPERLVGLLADAGVADPQCDVLGGGLYLFAHGRAR